VTAQKQRSITFRAMKPLYCLECAFCDCEMKRPSFEGILICIKHPPQRIWEYPRPKMRCFGTSGNRANALRPRVLEVHMFSSDRFRFAVCLAGLMFAISPLLAVSADARSPGGGGGGAVHVGGGGGVHVGGGGFGGGGLRGGGGFGGGIGRSVPMIHSAPMIRSSPSLHSLSGSRSSPGIVISRGHGVTVRHAGTPHIASSRGVTRHVSTPHVARSHVASGNVATRHIPTSRTAATSGKVAHGANRTVAADGRGQVNRNLVTRSVKGAGRASALRNNAFASLSTRNAASRALASATYHGRFAGKDWRYPSGGWYWHHHHRPFIVIGWFGPLFWPFAYWDFIDYTFWPYAYDVFWPYAYDDVYWGFYGPYAYPDPVYVNAPSAPSGGGRARTAKTATAAATTIGEVCSNRPPVLTDWPIEQIAKTVEPDQIQQTALNELKDATTKALGVLQAACPNDLPSIPTGRLQAMRKRIEAMLQAASIVRPVLERFYNSLSDEQKARFNAVAPEEKAAPTGRGARPEPDLAQVCSGQAAKATDVPTRRLEQVLRPSDAQRSALDALNDATIKAADVLKANCPGDEALTPPGRVAAMEQRLNAMLQAINIVQLALQNFYSILSDDQKARFNALGAPQS